MNSRVREIIRKAKDMEGLFAIEAEELLRVEIGSLEYYTILHAADEMSRTSFGPKGENHFHIGVNVAPCPHNCAFCSLTPDVGIFNESREFTNDELIRWARIAEAGSADAINLMTTGKFKFDRFLEIGRILSNEVSVPLVANTRDITHREGEKLIDAGFVGFYHAVRLGEGKDTPFTIDLRIKTIKTIREVGLNWMNCIEPVGPEHTPEEMARLMVLARENGATYSGAMRRINFPGSPCEARGMVTERELALVVAVSRLVMGDIPRAHCAHEPNSAALMAGANLFFPEVGSSPRDSVADTGEGRGHGLDYCHGIMGEMGLDPLLPSNCFHRAPRELQGVKGA
jgi:biotin synthase